MQQITWYNEFYLVPSYLSGGSVFHLFDIEKEDNQGDEWDMQG